MPATATDTPQALRGSLEALLNHPVTVAISPRPLPSTPGDAFVFAWFAAAPDGEPVAAVAISRNLAAALLAGVPTHLRPVDGPGGVRRVFEALAAVAGPDVRLAGMGGDTGPALPPLEVRQMFRARHARSDFAVRVGGEAGVLMWTEV